MTTPDKAPETPAPETPAPETAAPVTAAPDTATAADAAVSDRRLHATVLTADQATELAAEFDLHPIGLRPSIPAYLRQLWARRFFIIELSRAREQSNNADSRLGQFWTVLNPLLNIAVYFLIFGVLFKANRSVPNYISFLVIGVFIFTYTQSAVLQGARSIASNLGIVRAFHFPRAVLPVSTVVEELFSLAPALVICMAIVLVTGEGITFAWLLMIPALVLQTGFNLGLVFLMARLTERIRDVAQLLPFLLRTWLYLSGVVFPIQTFAQEHKGLVGFLLSFNPAAVYIELVRDALLTSYSVPPITWVYAVFWAVLALLTGFIYFWKAEARYGRG